jgi:secondary thiamine-phosphate synthase enzyme
VQLAGRLTAVNGFFRPIVCKFVNKVHEHLQLNYDTMIWQTEIKLPAYSRGYHEITRQIMNALPQLPEAGLLNVFIHHTSAGLMINENADPSVLSDMEKFFNHIVPENMPFLDHTIEGPDDMPAHVKSAIAGVSLTIPIAQGRLKLGTWQGIMLCEFRNRGGNRRITLTIYH